ncbi:MAG TPA: hypothetical protein VN802_08970 [Stellaceae bacterium]|nr:hypothetical protein [Stellaceae bacterium]
MMKTKSARVARLACLAASLLALGACVYYPPPPAPAAYGYGPGYYPPGYAYGPPVVGGITLGFGGGYWGHRGWR